MPQGTFVEIPAAAQAQRLAVLRRARDGSRLARHLLWWCAAGRRPTAIAAVLVGSRSRVSRPVRAYQEGSLSWAHEAQGQLLAPVRTTVRLPTRRRALLALLKTPPRAYAWGRTRWSWATRALTRHATRGLAVSAEPLRRWLHEIGWGWKRAKLVAKDDAPHRIARLARLRSVVEPLRRGEAMVLADAWAIPLFPNRDTALLHHRLELAIAPGSVAHCT